MHAIEPSHDPISKHRAQLLIAFGLALHVAIYLISYGSFDVHNLQWSGQRVLRIGIVEAYRADKLINHPPLAALWFASAEWISVRTPIAFPYICKLPMLAANVGTIVLLWRMKRIAAVLFALSPIAILVAAHHCNTDPVYTFFAVASLYFLQSQYKISEARERVPTLRNPFLAGLMLAAAMNVKLMVVPLMIGLFIAIDRARDRIRFAIGMSIGAIPFLVLIAVASWHVVYRDIFAYAGNAGHWGVSELLEFMMKCASMHRAVDQIGTAYMHDSKWILLLATTALALRFHIPKKLNSDVPIGKRDVAIYWLAAGIACLFFVISPAFGMQYTIYPLPLILLVSCRWGIAYSLIGGAILIAEYARSIGGGFPIGIGGPVRGNPAGPWLALMLWAFFVFFSAMIFIRMTIRRMPGGNVADS